MTRVVVEKSKRLLTAFDAAGVVLLQCRVALGRVSTGHKRAEGDGCTPEGDYFICLKRETGKFGCALGISYPSYDDALSAVAENRLDRSLLPLFEAAEREQKRPPWGTALGGEIYLHGGGTSSDWTAGCIALEDADMQKLFQICQLGDRVRITP